MDNYGNGNSETIMMNQQQNSPKRPVQATLSLVFGIISILLAFCGCGGFIGVGLGVAALILSASARKQMTPDGVLKAGTVTAIIGTVLSVIGIILFFVLGAFSYVLDQYESGNTEANLYSSFNGDTIEDLDSYFDSISTSEEPYEGDTDEPEAGSTDEPVYLPVGTQWVGSPEVGYTAVPTSFVTFLEAGGTGWDYTEQYANGFEIVGLYAENDYSAYDLAQAMAASLENGEIAGVDLDSVFYYQDSIGGYDGYMITSYYPADNMYLYQWVFDAEDGRAHYISAEYFADGDNTDLWITAIYNWRLTAPDAE